MRMCSSTVGTRRMRGRAVQEPDPHGWRGLPRNARRAPGAGGASRRPATRPCDGRHAAALRLESRRREWRLTGQVTRALADWRAGKSEVTVPEAGDGADVIDLPVTTEETA